MNIKADDFRLGRGEKVELSQWPTQSQPLYDSKDDYKVRLAELVKKLSDQQQLLYASNEYALLVVFQAMDAAGKDSAIRHVFSGINPQGCQVHSFKHPTASELKHDFLWRTTAALPERGRIGVFNRSYYEEVLIARVHPEILRAEDLPPHVTNTDAVWRGRYQSIVDQERHLHANGTRVIKFFLHLSKEEQRQRFLARIDSPEKNWKFGLADVEERKHWKQYMKAYEACLTATSTADSPWYIVPADDKKSAHLIIAQTILDTLTALKMRYPVSSGAKRKELQALGKLLRKPERARSTR